ncbi:hypothetical protein AAHE18_15G182300 [Arachis hypogaea]
MEFRLAALLLGYVDFSWAVRGPIFSVFIPYFRIIFRILDHSNGNNGIYSLLLLFSRFV